MSVAFPDPETVRAVLTLAGRAPSVHNSQPWHWRIGSKSLQLYADPSRHLPSTDPDRRDMLLSCGAALHHCTVALAAMGWHAKVHRLPNGAGTDHLATIEVTAQPPEELDIMLAAAITRRRTDRRNYSSWPVPWGDIALMGARAARAGVMLRQVDLIPRLAAEPDPAASIPSRVFAGPALRQPAAAPSGSDNAVVIVLGTEHDDELAWLRAGEATSLVLLSATAMGLASCPVTEPLEIPSTREAVRADVFGDSGHPQMMVRVGWAAVGADPLPSTPRRPLPEVVDWRNDGAFGVGSGAVSRAG